MSISTASTKKGFFDGRKVWFFFAAIAAVVAAVIIFVLLQAVTATTTYYVLSQDLPARTLITQSDLTAVTTSVGGEPRTALTLGDALGNATYTKYSLKAGDILTSSNAGALTSLTKGLPSDFVIASFTASPSVAAGGNIQRGDYVDIYATTTGSNGGDVTHMFLQRVLIVDATINLDSASSSSSSSSTTSGSTTSSDTSGSGTGSDATDQQSFHEGVPTLFTVGLTQEDAAKLAVATDGTYKLYVVLSSDQSVKDGASSADIGAGDADITSGATGDAGFGTDNTFGSGGKAAKGGTADGETTGSSSTPKSIPTSTPTPTGTATPGANN
jgi:Flp pilus assembly protein CpaB